MATLIAKRTTAMQARARMVNRLSVPLEIPVNASPTTGRTGTPQPATEHGPVVRPITLPKAPAIPAGRAALRPSPQASAWLRRWAQSAKYVPNNSEVTRIRASDGTSMMKPHSRPSTGLSALNHPMAMVDRKASFLLNWTSWDARYSGSRESQGLKVKKSTGFRTKDRRTTGAAKLNTATPATTPQKSLDRARTAVAIPRNVFAISSKALNIAATMHRPVGLSTREVKFRLPRTMVGGFVFICLLGAPKAASAQAA